LQALKLIALLLKNQFLNLTPVKNISPSKPSLFSPEDIDTPLFLSLTNQNSEISLSQLLKLQS
jgi:hypothetical protein